jgi:hypothetical protein
MSATLDDYRQALEDAFHDLRRRDRRSQVARAMEGVEELDAEGLARLGRPVERARAYRSATGIRYRPLHGLGTFAAVAAAVSLAVLGFRYVDGYRPSVDNTSFIPGRASSADLDGGSTASTSGAEPAAPSTWASSSTTPGGCRSTSSASAWARTPSCG